MDDPAVGESLMGIKGAAMGIKDSIEGAVTIQEEEVLMQDE